MKKFTLALFIVILTTNLMFSQSLSNLVFFSEDGYPFHVIMNGIKENQNPQSNVKIFRLSAPNYKVKIVFEDKTIPSIEKNVYTKPDMELTYAIKKNKKGQNVMRFYSEAPILIEDGVEEIIIVENSTVRQDYNDNNPDNSGGVSIDINLNESGINYNVETEEGSININANININDSNSSADFGEDIYLEDDQTRNVYQMPGYSGAIGCDWPMNLNDFQNAKKTIVNADFEDDKLTIAKQVLGMNCLTTKQVKEIGMLFDFEDTKLDFAKFAYNRTYDLGNYYLLNDMFEFSSSIEELNTYINSQK